MDIIFVNLEASECSDLHRLMLHLKGKKIKKKTINMLHNQVLVFTLH